MDDFVNAIAYEVKQEIANRYFGFRSRTAGEIEEYLAKLAEADREQLGGIRLELKRMKVLLHREKYFKDFLLLMGLPPAVAGEPAPDPALLFTGLKGEGFTHWRRFRDLAFQVYQALAGAVVAYRAAWVDLDDQHAEICTRIDEFHRNNDLSGILSFLRTFDCSEAERLKFLHTESATRPGRSIDQELRIPHPRSVADILPEMPSLPPLKQVKTALEDLLRSAYATYDSPQSILPV